MVAQSPLLSYRDVASLLTLEESRLRYWAQTGLVGPSVRKGGRQYFTFGDLVQVKAAKELVERGLPVQRVRKSVEMLRSQLPGIDRPVARLRVCSDGERVVVLSGDVAFEPESGQVVMDFDVGPLTSEAARLSGAEFPPPGDSAIDCFGSGTAAEEQGDDAAAERFYLRALAADPRLAAACTNLGNICYRRGQREEARARYEQALELDPDQPEARYNLANVLDELGERELALAEYRRALLRTPDFSDAHFNLAVALERGGRRVEARVHYTRYLELAQEDEWSAAARDALDRLT
jgi:tetratricopeptide (TPR) repeat protein